MVTSALVSLCLLLGADPDIDSVRAKLRSRQQAIRSLDVTYTADATHAIYSKVGSAARAASLAAGPQRFRWVQQGTQKLLSSEVWIDPVSKQHHRYWYSFDGRHAYSIFFAPQAMEHAMEINKTHAINRYYSVYATLAKALGYSIHFSPHSLMDVIAQPNAVFEGIDKHDELSLYHVSVPHFEIWDGMASRLDVWLAPSLEFWPQKIDVEWLGMSDNPQRTGIRTVYVMSDFQQHSDAADPSIKHWFPMKVTDGVNGVLNVQSVEINKTHSVEVFRPVATVGVKIIDETELRNLEIAPGHFLRTPVVQIVGGLKGEEEYERIAALSRKLVGLEEQSPVAKRPADASAPSRFSFGITFLAVALIAGAAAIWLVYRR